MSIPKGPKTVTCTECGVQGTIYIGRELRSGEIKVKDYIEHKDLCSRNPRPQPAHFRNKRGWRKQEERANSLVGAHATVASGAVGEDGDGRAFGEWRVEAKQTGGPLFTITQRVWEKLVTGANRVSEEPMLHIELRDRTPYFRICVIRRELFEAWSETSPGNATNKRVHRDNSFPRALALNPPAVAIPEDFFLYLRKLHES